jgi:hypothetical protein
MKDNKLKKSDLDDGLCCRINLACLNPLFHIGDIKIGDSKEDFIITKKKDENGLVNVRHKCGNNNSTRNMEVSITLLGGIVNENGAYIKNKKFDPFTCKVLDYSLELLLANNNGWIRGKSINEIKGEINIIIKDLTKLVGLKDTKDNRKYINRQARESLNIIQSIIINMDSKKEANSFYDVSIIEYKSGKIKGIRTSKIKLKFTNSFLKILSKHSYVDKVPVELYKIGSDPYILGSELCRQWRLNEGGKRQGIHSIKWILEFLKIPINHRKFKEKIKEPFERAMNALSPIFDQDLFDSKGNKMDKNSTVRRDDFLKLRVKLTPKYLTQANINK